VTNTAAIYYKGYRDNTKINLIGNFLHGITQMY